MPQKTKSPHPDWAIKYRKPGTELRYIKGKYYLYEVKSVYDKDRKRSKKVTGTLLGKITKEDGFIESKKQKQLKAASKPGDQLPDTVLVQEYGVSQYITTYFQDQIEALKRNFGTQWNLILGIAYTRLLHQAPIKNMPLHLANSYLAEWAELPKITEKKVSGFLRELGQSKDKMTAYMKSFINEGDFLLIDATDILCKSQHISLASKGYNNKLDFQPQFNLLYLFSSSDRMPAFYRIVPGNIREIKAFKNTIDESGITNSVLIGDKGFYSKDNITHLETYGLSYIIPLRRNNKLIDYSTIRENTFKEANEYFKYAGRTIWYKVFDIEGRRLVLYLDERLKVHEEEDYMKRIDTHPEDYTIEKYQEKRNRFGTLALYTPLKAYSPQKLYETYKGRNSIETMFEGMKSVLNADSTYMQNEDALQGWMFINHVALQWYQSIYLHLYNEGMLKKYSVKDVLTHLKKIQRIKINEKWRTSEITSSIERLAKKLKLPIT